MLNPARLFGWQLLPFRLREIRTYEMHVNIFERAFLTKSVHNCGMSRHMEFGSTKVLV